MKAKYFITLFIFLVTHTFIHQVYAIESKSICLTTKQHTEGVIAHQQVGVLQNPEDSIRALRSLLK